MKTLQCEICGGSEFIKDEGLFKCQSCGTKYTAEDMRKMQSAAVLPANTAEEQSVSNMKSSSMTICTTCGKPISSNADVCPKCGAPKANLSPMKEYKILVNYLKYNKNSEPSLYERIHELKQVTEVREYTEQELIFEHNKKKKRIRFLSIIAVCIVVLIAMLIGAILLHSYNQSTESISLNSVDSLNSKVDTVDRELIHEENIKFIEDLSANEKITTYEEAKTVMGNINRASAIWRCEEDSKVAEKMKKKIISYQKTNFPKLRKCVANFMSQQMTGKGYKLKARVSGTTLILTSPMFNDVSYIYALHDTWKNIYVNCRFKKVNYINSNGGGKTHDIMSAKDDEI